MRTFIWGVVIRIILLTFATAVLMPAAEKGPKSEEDLRPHVTVD